MKLILIYFKKVDLKMNFFYGNDRKIIKGKKLDSP